MTFARKQYSCNWCGGSILKGHNHFSQTVFGEDGPGTIRLHIECRDAIETIPSAEQNECWDGYGGHAATGHNHEPNDKAKPNCPGCIKSIS